MPHIVDACDGELAFDGMLILGAIAEVLETNFKLSGTTIANSVRMLQKRIKYGLPNSLSVRLYELGFGVI
jgi:POLQ-like helicase